MLWYNGRNKRGYKDEQTGECYLPYAWNAELEQFTLVD